MAKNTECQRKSRLVLRENSVAKVTGRSTPVSLQSRFGNSSCYRSYSASLRPTGTRSPPASSTGAGLSKIRPCCGRCSPQGRLTELSREQRFPQICPASSCFTAFQREHQGKAETQLLRPLT